MQKKVLCDHPQEPDSEIFFDSFFFKLDLFITQKNIIYINIMV